MANYLKDIASVPASAIPEVEGDVRTQLAMGEIGLSDIGDAIQEGLEDYALGKIPRMKRPPGQRGPRSRVKGGGKGKPGPMPPPLPDRRYMVPAPSRTLIRRGGHLNGLGDIFDDAAKAVSAGLQSGAIPPAEAEHPQALPADDGLPRGRPRTRPGFEAGRGTRVGG